MNSAELAVIESFIGLILTGRSKGMARGSNKVILIGNCGQDPETKYMPSGGAVRNISIATSESWKDKQTGEMGDADRLKRIVLL